MNLFRMSVRDETEILQINKVNSRRLPIGNAQCFLEKPDVRTATDHDSIESLPPGTRGKLVYVNFRIAREGKHGRRGRKN